MRVLLVMCTDTHHQQRAKPDSNGWASFPADGLASRSFSPLTHSPKVFTTPTMPSIKTAVNTKSTQHQSESILAIQHASRTRARIVNHPRFHRFPQLCQQQFSTNAIPARQPAHRSMRGHRFPRYPFRREWIGVCFLFDSKRAAVYAAHATDCAGQRDANAA